MSLVKKMVGVSFALVVLFSAISAQRSPYAGSRPTGYKDRLQGQGQNSISGGADIGNRFGEGSTERLPYDAHGDAIAVQHGLLLPEANRPFWLLNQGHIEAQRGTPASGSNVNLVTQRPPLTAANETAFGGNGGVASRVGLGDAPVNQNVNVINNLDANVYGPNDNDVVYPSNISPEQRRQMEAVIRQQTSQAQTQNVNSGSRAPQSQNSQIQIAQPTQNQQNNAQQFQQNNAQQIQQIQQQQRQFPQRPQVQFQQSLPQGVQQPFQPVNSNVLTRQTRQFPRFNPYPQFQPPSPYYEEPFFY